MSEPGFLFIHFPKKTNRPEPAGWRSLSGLSGPAGAPFYNIIAYWSPKVRQQGNSYIHKISVGTRFGGISDLIFTGVGRVPRNERLVYTKCSVSQKLRARENSEFRYQKVTREGKFKMTIHSLLNKIWMQPVWRKGFRDFGFSGSYRRGEINKTHYIGTILNR